MRPEHFRFKTAEPGASKEWTCCICLHVRTATIMFGLWHMLLHILAMSIMVALLNNPNLLIENKDGLNPPKIMANQIQFGSDQESSDIFADLENEHKDMSRRLMDMGPTRKPDYEILRKQYTRYSGLHTVTICYETTHKGPSFLIEPPTKVEFSNSSGAWLDCTATGSPSPSIEWVTMDGSPLMDIPGVRRTARNGTLILYPFSAGAFRQDIHSAIYRCLASNSIGTIISRDVQIRAVVVQSYKVDVVVLGAARGCTAILQCVIPSFVKDLVRVISWVQEPSFHIYPSLQGDGKFHVLPTGELLVSNLDFSDQFPTYKCRTMHRLTRHVVVSAGANVRINDHRSLVAPSVVGLTGTVQVGHDEGAVMVCLAQACPHSDYRWYRTDHNMEPLLVLPGPRTRVLGPILAIEGVTTDDSGTYRCSSSNIGGEATAEIRLSVASPYRVEVTPPLLSVHLDGTATFQCDISPYDSGPYLVAWFKDGRPLPGRSSSASLTISPVGREDRGIYQCIVRRGDGDTAQGAAELQLGDTPPILTYSFIEQTLQPGPAVSLKCIATGNPAPEVRWTLDGFELPANNRFVIGQFVSGQGDVISHVNISHVTVEDGGEYSCTAVNRAGQATHSARLNIYGLPYVRLIPKVTAIAGETLHIKCPVAGYPIEEIHWEKGGRELPDGIRQKLQPGGVLTITPVQKNEDTGVYTCWARNKQGHSARRSGEVVVIVPPKLSPTNPERNLNLGERASLICAVLRGDIPLTIKWLKDGRHIDSTSSALSITQVDEFNSMLVIGSVSARHSGNYSCTVKNQASEETQVTRLLVNVPPRWSVEPADVHEERNKAVMLNCQAEGVPEPTVIWKKAKDGKSGDYEEIMERQYTKLLSNGSLFLQNIKEDREGYYLCQASNGIGNPIGKLVQVKVNSPPYFSAPSHIVTVKKGDTARLQCSVNGDLPIQIQWIRAGSSLDLNAPNGYRLSMKQESISEEGVKAELTISGTEPTDGGAYFCQASNVYGKDQQLVQLLVQEPPESPSDLKTVLVTSRAINVQWHHASVNSAEVSHFIVQHKSGQDGTWKQVELNGQLRGCLLEDLKPATRYTIRVFAEGRAGRSLPSESLLVLTEPQQPAGPPLNIVARAVSSTQLLVTWSPPVQELRNGDVQGYNLGFLESSSGNSGSSGYNMTGLVGDGAEEGAEYLLTDLAKFTRYAIVVQAVNQVGPGPLSEPVTAQTLEDVPSMPPEDIRCGASSSHSLQVSWKPPPVHHCNGILQGYKLQYDSQDEGLDDFDSKKTSSLTLMLTNLHKYTNYSVQVLAMTRVGEGVYSEPIYCQTSEDAPGSPEDIKVVVSSPQSLLVTWLAPKEPNGIITKYNLYTRSMTGREELAHKKTSLMSQQLNYEVKNLNEHVEYQFWITASTRVGEGQSSKVISQIPTSRVPAKISSFGGVIRRPWRSSVSLSCSMVGVPPPRRTWLRGDTVVVGGSGVGRNIQIADGGGGGELVISNLQATESDNYTCLVENNVGSDKITYALLVQVVPSTPVLYVASATSSSILLHWRVSDNGGSPVTSFLLSYKKSNGDLQQLVLHRKTVNYELKGLTCGSTYHISLLVRNKLGPSHPSSPIAVRTQGQYPGTPSRDAFLLPNATSVGLKLHVWPDNGCKLLYFVVKYRSVNDIDWIVVSNSLKPQRRFTISNLLPNTEYQLQVEAHNIAGASTGDFQFFTLTKDGDLSSPDSFMRGRISSALLLDLRFILPAAGVFVLLLSVIVSLCAICRRLKSGRRRNDKELDDNEQNLEAQRDRYYATMQKVALHDKIPETSEEISPYATFQLEPPALLHSFRYQDDSVMPGCASTPPMSISKMRRRRRSSGRKTDVDSEDSEESDQEPLTSSRTESSNHLDKKLHDNRFIYHGAQSSTSSDMSPMAEQKSLPRRGPKSRWLATPSRSGNLRAPHMALPEAPPAPFRSGPELSEAECDIDTLKKLKLGLRSSLWSKPAGGGSGGGGGNSQGDYSIAV